MNQEHKYQEMMKNERKKLKKDLKKKNGDELLLKLMQADKDNKALSPKPKGRMYRGYMDGENLQSKRPPA